jgi:ribonuclease VapC
MVVDTSVLVAILLKEIDYERFMERAGLAPSVIVGSPTAFEAAMVVSSRSGHDERAKLIGLLRSLKAEVVPFTPEHYEAAVSAFLRYGKGRHPAGLNFGDCMSYALAVVSGLPLLYTGDDFSRTDVQAA